MRERPASGTQSTTSQRQACFSMSPVHPPGPPSILHPSFHSSTRPSVHLPIHPSISPSRSPPLHLSTHPSIQPPVHPSTHPCIPLLSTHQSTHLSSIHSSIFASIKYKHRLSTGKTELILSGSSSLEDINMPAGLVMRAYTRPFLWEHCREGAVYLQRERTLKLALQRGAGAVKTSKRQRCLDRSLE